MAFNNIGNIIKSKRKELKLTQAQLAELINTDVYYISKIETGKKKPGRKFLISLSNVLEIPIDFLLGLESNLILHEHVSDLEIKLQKLSEKDKEMVLDILEQLIERLSTDN